MKIAYIAFEHFQNESGVLKKVIEQIKAWEHEGNKVKLFVISRHPNIWIGAKDISTEVILEDKNTKLTDYLFGRISLNEKVTLWNPDIVYVRAPFKSLYLKRIVKRIPTVVEINSNDLAEYEYAYVKRYKSRTKPHYALFKYKSSRLAIFKKSQGLVFVTSELSRMHYASDVKPYIVIPNGIDLPKYPGLPLPDNPFPHLTFMGTAGFHWHGTEKIIQLAKHFPNWHFDFVGYSKTDLDEKPPDNVHLHGRMGQEDYLPILEKADVAIGTLSLYKKKMNEACPLKVREYLAYGIPTITGYKDLDFPNGADFLLQLPNTPDNVQSNLNKIQKFVEQWKGRKVKREQIQHLDVRLKEKRRIEFFDNIL